MATTISDLMDGTDGFTISGRNASDNFGNSARVAGDVNGDGFDDIIVGARSADPDGIVRGEAAVVFGTAAGFAAEINVTDLDGADGFRMSGPTSGENFGQDSATAGDFNGDGIDDFFVGAGSADQAGSNFGAVYLVFGTNAGFTANFDVSALDGADGVRFDGVSSAFTGFNTSDAGDINGDGLADIVIGAPNDGTAASNSGSAFVVFGTSDNLGAAVSLGSLDGSDGFRVNGEFLFDRVGGGVGGGGDINGDGLSDVVIGATGRPDSSGDPGNAHIIFGRTDGFDALLDYDSLDGADGFSIAGLAIADQMGSEISTEGDFNGDGIDDLLVTVRGDDLAEQGAGSAYVVFGKSTGFGADVDITTLDGSDGFQVFGLDNAAINSNLGEGDNVGDFNGDGIDDMFFGTRQGYSGVIFGQTEAFSKTVDFRTITAAEGEEFTSIRDSSGAGQANAAGDLNGDGLMDVVIANTEFNSDRGVAQVIFGHSDSLTKVVGTTGGDALSGTADGEQVIAGAGNDIVRAHGGDDVAKGGAGNDILSMSAGNDRGFGGNGNDKMVGAAGDDFLYGEDGNDLLAFGNGGGADYMDGGAGNDRFILKGSDLGAGDKLLGGEGLRDVLIFSDNSTADLTAADAIHGIERIILREGQTVTGVDDAFNWYGRGGAETINGGDARDIMRGAAGDDTLNGGGGNDVLVGGAGADTIAGGAGLDKLIGGADGDTFVFAAGGGVDMVIDYTDGTDQIDASAYGFANFAQLAARIDTVNGKAVVDFALGDRAVLLGVNAGDLDAGDFILT